MNNNTKLEVNLHTHTVRCGHASGMPEDYCRAALDSDIKILGFSDHGPFPDDRFNHSRMPYAELNDYCGDIRRAQELFPSLKLFAGLEIEYCSDIDISYYKDYLLGELGLDYLIGATHFVYTPDGAVHPFNSRFRETPEVLNEFVRHTIRTMENLPVLYMAHPDCMGSIAERITPELKSGFRDIIEAAADLDIPLEINANGFRKGLFQTGEGMRFRYPLEAFWEIAAENGHIRTVIGMDAHSPGVLTDQFDACLAFANRFGLHVCNDELVKVKK